MKLAERRRRRIADAGKTLKQNAGSQGVLADRVAGNSRQAGTTRSLSRRAGDVLHSWQTSEERFHLNSLVGQIWFVQLREYTEARYAEPAGAKGRGLQTGFAWRSFAKLFEPLSSIELVRLFENLLRFANYEAYPPARAFFLAYAPLSFEHDISGEYIGPGVWTPEAGSRNAVHRVRRTLRRWCQWMEALAHFQVHEARKPFSIHREFDKLIILLWPLAMRHNWGYLDLLNVLRSLGCGKSFPCPSEGQLAEYCQTALRLQLTSRPIAAKETPIAGQVVAERLFKFLPTIS
jgi:hypothetical protein